MKAIEGDNVHRVTPNSAVGQWEEVVSLTHLDVTTTPDTAADPRPFHGRIRHRMVDDIAIIDCVCMPCRGDRGRGRIAAADGEYVGILQVRRGIERLSDPDNGVEVTPGAVVCWDSRDPIRYQVPVMMSKRNLFLPVSAVEEVAGHTWRHKLGELDPSQPGLRLLLAYLDVLAANADSLSGPAATAARNAVLDLFVGAVAAEPSPHTRIALRATVDAWIERNLSRDLTPAMIAAEHRVSVRTVYRLYEETGDTLAGMIRARRLAHAHDQVVADREPIATIARRWRFASSSHFSRAFRERYGATPSEVRLAAHTHPDTRIRHA